MFREEDREEMLYAFDLWVYADVCEYAASILDRVSDRTMPCDEPWTDEQVERFAAWIESGLPE